MPDDVATLIVSKKGWDFIIAHAVPSGELYKQKFQSPWWAGGDSGVIIGIGYDLGYVSKEEVAKTWGPYLTTSALEELQTVCGLKGAACKALLSALADITILYNIALKVFYTVTLPACAYDVRQTYTGVEKLPPDAQAALLSLVYSRGPLINDTDRRREMKALVPLVALGDLKRMADQIRSMKRLWDPKKSADLIDQREKEAVLIEHARFEIPAEDLIEI